MGNWNTVLFSDIADFKNGLNFKSGETGYVLKILGIGDFQNRISLNQVDQISTVHTEKEIDSSYHLRDGDLVFVRSNGNKALVGRCMLIEEPKEKISFSGFSIRARLTTTDVLPAFVNLLMQAGILKNVLKRDSHGTNIKSLNQGILSKLKIPLTNISEQNDILGFFDKWDTAIEKTEALIDAKERRFEWLVKNLISTPQNLSKWKRTTLAEIGDISSAGVDKKIVNDEEDVVLLNYLDVYHRDQIYAKELQHRVTAPSLKVINCSIKKGDIFFTPSSEVRRDIGHSAVAMEDIGKGVYSYHIIRLRPKIEINTLYSAYAFKGFNFYKQVSKYADGSGQRYVVSQNNFRKLEISLPPLEEQKRIAETLNTARHEINLLKKLADQYRTQKRGLMQKLLSGKWSARHSCESRNPA